MNKAESNNPHELPIDGVLDLHGFRPQDAAGVLCDYIEMCRQRNILEMRVIHGKGIGNLRRTVHSLLSRHPAVTRIAMAHPLYGGEGATIVHLRPPATSGPD